MIPRPLVLLMGTAFVGGCLWPVHQATDQSVAAIVARPLDISPEPVASAPAGKKPADTVTREPVAPAKKNAMAPVEADVQTASLLEDDDKLTQAAPGKRYELTIPPAIPGSETPPIKVPEDKVAREAYLRQLYPVLPPLAEEPKPVPGPNGLPYTLADLQRIAAENSPALRQAAAAVEVARGAMIQSGAYPNPTVSYQQGPSNDNSTPGFFGFGVDQTIKTFGKLKLAQASAQKALDNAELALRRARSNLVTSVRTAYFGVLVAKETMRVNYALAHFTDEIYRIHADQTAAGIFAYYEPATMRSMAYTARLAYNQSIANYSYAWKQMVAAVNLPQLPLSEVAGRIDRFIPAYDYDTFLAQVLRRHTDVLTARNGIEAAKYNLKLAQITPYPDVDVSVIVQKDLALAPFGISPTVAVSVPLPVWDQNKGNIISAQGSLDQALEQPHLVEVTITGGVAAAFAAYKTNLDALEYYRRYILPDQVRAYRGIYVRRQIDINVAFGDLVSAQQSLASGVTTYLTTLGTLWTSVVALADYLQTEDLFQTGKSIELPPLPELDLLAHWPCGHPTADVSTTPADGTSVPPSTKPEAAPRPAPAAAPSQKPGSAPRPMPAGPVSAAPASSATTVGHVQSTSWKVSPATAKGDPSEHPSMLPDPAQLGTPPAELPRGITGSAGPTLQ